MEIKFTEVYGTINNGGAFSVMGVPCMKEEEKVLD
jgi:hypothetical protein